jgi:hypothetical protein
MRPGRLLCAAALALALHAAGAAPPVPRVATVQPSASEVPANLLRISIEFAAPVAVPVLPRLALAYADGRPVQEPFLQQELWSPSGKILTVLLHPGRVKSGLRAREAMGPVLEVGDDIVLTLDGVALRRWVVRPDDRSGPMPAAWKLAPVSAGSRQALVVTLDGAIDGRDADYLAIADSGKRRVEGRAALKDGERVWTFTPRRPWGSGAYKLMVRGTLEDPAGNRLGGRFETAMDRPAAPTADAAIAFVPVR